jgi:hypothetical protein
VLVVAIGGHNQRTGVANGHSGTPESLGEQIVVVAAEVGTAAGERITGSTLDQEAACGLASWPPSSPAPSVERAQHRHSSRRSSGRAGL